MRVSFLKVKKNVTSTYYIHGEVSDISIAAIGVQPTCPPGEGKGWELALRVASQAQSLLRLKST